MRSLALRFPSRHAALYRLLAQWARPVGTALRPHVPVLRLVVVLVLGFLLAYYLDTRSTAPTHGSLSSPTAPAYHSQVGPAR